MRPESSVWDRFWWLWEAFRWPLMNCLHNEYRGRPFSRKSAPPFCCIYAVVAARRATKQAATIAYMQQNGGRHFRTFLHMLEVCSCMPKHLCVNCDHSALSNESHVFDESMCFDMYFTILSWCAFRLIKLGSETRPPISVIDPRFSGFCTVRNNSPLAGWQAGCQAGRWRVGLVVGWYGLG